MSEIVAKDATRRVTIRGRSWDVPCVARFSGVGWYFFAVVDFRKPKKGEYYLSGAFPEVYVALNDLTYDFLVVQKTERAIRFQGWTREG